MCLRNTYFSSYLSKPLYYLLILFFILRLFICAVSYFQRSSTYVYFISFLFPKWTFALVDSLYCIFAFRLIDFHSYLYGFLPSPLFVFILLFSYLSCLAHLFSAPFSSCISIRSCKFGLQYVSVLALYLGVQTVAELCFLLQLARRQQNSSCKCGTQAQQAWTNV